MVQIWLNFWRIRARVLVKSLAAAMPTNGDLCAGVMFTLNVATIFLPGTKTEAAPRTIPMPDRLREFLVRLKAEKKPQPTDRITPIQSARKCLQTACKKLSLPQFTHHDFRHFFATTCIESGVDISHCEPLAWT